MSDDTQDPQVLAITNLLKHPKNKLSLDLTAIPFFIFLGLAQVVPIPHTNDVEYSIRCFAFAKPRKVRQEPKRCIQRIDKNILHAYIYRIWGAVKDIDVDLRWEFEQVANVFLCHHHFKDDAKVKRFVDHCVAKALEYRQLRSIGVSVHTVQQNGPSLSSQQQAATPLAIGAESTADIRSQYMISANTYPETQDIKMAPVMTAAAFIVTRLEGTYHSDVECLQTAIHISELIYKRCQVDDFESVLTGAVAKVRGREWRSGADGFLADHEMAALVILLRNAFELHVNGR
ncbi:hypothetical protein LTR56_009696 [Elasticomyces elasticus]|nr:hypothetical protein LTR56_009696 [Elasticomyces elasticus]KAK3660196.1 hypothetical protein LTR22_008203 [Elasticomyces elasticus]KAK4923502.1 hypothetical protein LTR49_009376 [Elasticomyces elasticus]KAK5752460.1 hypothetical protein LTS12_017496 [Elasticomyces elasticus]